jgi:hypothetical protein
MKLSGKLDAKSLWVFAQQCEERLKIHAHIHMVGEKVEAEKVCIQKLLGARRLEVSAHAIDVNGQQNLLFLADLVNVWNHVTQPKI